MAWFWQKSKNPTTVATATTKPTPTTFMGIAGHGLLLGPACPCRIAVLDDKLIISRGYTGPLVTEAIITLGQRAAFESPAQISEGLYGTGTGAPTITMDQGGATFDEIFVSVNVGVGEGAWSILACGFWFDVPALVLFSPGSQDDTPELHHPLSPGAMISFHRIATSVHNIAAKWQVGQTIALGDRTFHSWQYDYPHEGQTWTQRKVALPVDDTRSIVVNAQAPKHLWDEIAAAADVVVGTFEPVEIPQA